MAKRVKKKPSITRKQVSRVEQERLQQRNIMIGIAAVAGVVVILILFGIFDNQVLEPKRESANQTATVETFLATMEAADQIPAVTVQDEMISIADWQARVRSRRSEMINTIDQYENQGRGIDKSTQVGQQIADFYTAQVQSMRNQLDLADILAGEVLDQMIDEELIRQEAQRRGIIVSTEQVQEKIQTEFFGYPYPPTAEPDLRPTATLPPDITPVPTITPTVQPTPISPEEFQEQYQASIEYSTYYLGMTEERWQNLVEAIVYREELLQLIEQEVEPRQLQVQVDYISIQEQTEAEALLQRLEAGEQFADLMQELKESEDTMSFAGNRDWATLGELSASFGAEFEKVAFNTQPGNFVSQVVAGPGGGFYLIYVQGLEERELTTEALEQQAETQLETWLATAKISDQIVYGDDWKSAVPTDPVAPAAAPAPILP